MIKIILLFLIAVSINFAQTFNVEKVNGKVKVLSNGSEQWQEVKTNAHISSKTILSTE